MVFLWALDLIKPTRAFCGLVEVSEEVKPGTRKLLLEQKPTSITAVRTIETPDLNLIEISQCHWGGT